MLEVADVGPGDVVYDLGCGDGRVLLMAVEAFGADRAVGFEIDRRLCHRLTEKVRRRGLADRIEVVHRDLFDADLSRATVISIYLTERGNNLLKPKLLAEATPGTRVVSHNFDMPDWAPARRARLQFALYHPKIFLYVVPASRRPEHPS
jgi:16S rRNA A1518/A1519 N6-dimethyltransferase RsmA/KsgA/DIM1 with predicted DNA glycosylase/AP lyase activity